MPSMTSISNVLIGYLFSIVGGFIFIRLFNHTAWEYLTLLETEKPIDKNNKLQLWTAAQVGIVERLIYTSSILFIGIEIVAIWFGIKALSQWKRWETDSIRSRATFNNFLVGSGLSLLYGVLGGYIIFWLDTKDYMYVIGSMLGLILINLILWGWASSKVKQMKSDSSHEK
jgi:hypothetical protein